MMGELEDAARTLAHGLDRNLTSPNQLDRNLEPANVVDGLYAIARGLHDVADALRQDRTPPTQEGN